VINWLYALPEIVLLALPMATLVLAVLFGPRLVRRSPAAAPGDTSIDFSLAIQATLFTLVGLALTFTLVQADINFRQADSSVSTEAARLDQFDRLLTRYGDPGARAIRPMLKSYTRSIVEHDWPAMLADRQDEATTKAFTPISRGVLAIEPQTTRQTLILGEMLKSLDGIAEARAARLNLATIALPTIYWVVVLFAVTVVVFVSCVIPRTPFRSLLLAAQAAVLGAFVGFVFVMDQPFKGQTAIGPDSFVQTIARMEARTD
jgi:hypothetical protein